jgi:hypothetical protein
VVRRRGGKEEGRRHGGRRGAPAWLREREEGPVRERGRGARRVRERGRGVRRVREEAKWLRESLELNPKWLSAVYIH